MSTEEVDIVHNLTYKADTTELDAYIKKLRKVIKLQKKLNKMTDNRVHVRQSVNPEGLGHLVEACHKIERRKW